jgi:hypothetical protein
VVPLAAVVVGGLFLKKGYHILDPFQGEVPVPFQAVVFARSSVVEIYPAALLQDEKWVELVAAQGVELQTAVAMQMGLG